MIVKCIGNAPKHLKSDLEKQLYAQHVHMDEVDLDIGKKYYVYGILFKGEHRIPRFLVCTFEEEYEEAYPVFYLGGFFKVIDGKIPPGWIFTIDDKGDARLLPKYWVEDPYFYGKLVDGEPEAQAIFNQLREQGKEELQQCQSTLERFSSKLFKK